MRPSQLPASMQVLLAWKRPRCKFGLQSFGPCREEDEEEEEEEEEVSTSAQALGIPVAQDNLRGLPLHVFKVPLHGTDVLHESLLFRPARRCSANATPSPEAFLKRKASPSRRQALTGLLLGAAHPLRAPRGWWWAFWESKLFRAEMPRQCLSPAVPGVLLGGGGAAAADHPELRLRGRLQGPMPSHVPCWVLRYPKQEVPIPEACARIQGRTPTFKMACMRNLKNGTLSNSKRLYSSEVPGLSSENPDSMLWKL